MHALLPTTLPISGEIRKTFDIFIIIRVRFSLLLSRSVARKWSFEQKPLRYTAFRFRVRGRERKKSKDQSSASSNRGKMEAESHVISIVSNKRHFRSPSDSGGQRHSTPPSTTTLALCSRTKSDLFKRSVRAFYSTRAPLHRNTVHRR